MIVSPQGHWSNSFTFFFGNSNGMPVASTAYNAQKRANFGDYLEAISMALEDYDAEFGYSLSDFTKRYGRKAYEVPDYELRSVAEIERCAETHNYSEKSECLEHLKYLEELHKRLSMITFAEEREGMLNWELKEILEKVRKISLQLTQLSENLPVVVVYKEKERGGVRTGSKELITSTPAIGGHSEPVM